MKGPPPFLTPLIYARKTGEMLAFFQIFRVYATKEIMYTNLREASGNQEFMHKH